MKLLWLSSVDLSEPINRSGTWIRSMFNNIIDSDEIEELNIFTFQTIRNCSVVELKKGKQYTFFKKKGLFYNSFKNGTKSEIINIVVSLNPDIIHIWGTESGWDDIVNDPRLNNIPKLLEIQGLRTAICLPIYSNAGLDRLWERKSSFSDYILSSLKEIRTRIIVKRLVRNEQHLIETSTYISTQSEWVRSVIECIRTPSTQIFNSSIILRPDFVNQKPWSSIHRSADKKTIFILADLRVAKGIHTALEAIALVKSKVSDITVRIAGLPDIISLKSKYGYKGYLYRLIMKLGLQDDVNFLGYLDANEIRSEMYKCDVYLNTTYIESYCLSLAEALSIGVPCAVSYTSALPELIEDNVNGLLFPIGDIYICASKIKAILLNSEIAISLGDKAYSSMKDKTSDERSISQQLSTYRKILSKKYEAS